MHQNDPAVAQTSAEPLGREGLEIDDVIGDDRSLLDNGQFENLLVGLAYLFAFVDRNNVVSLAAELDRHDWIDVFVQKESGHLGRLRDGHQEGNPGGPMIDPGRNRAGHRPRAPSGH